MIVYTDTSALLKRVIAEAESRALSTLLLDRHAAGDLLVSSALTWVEVARSLTRADVEAVDDVAGTAMSGIDEFPLTPTVLSRARSVGPSSLRSLDAIHLASAILVGATGLLTYDDRLADAARSQGIQVLAPHG